MTEPTVPNPTAAKFGYPGSLIREYAHWVVLLRPHQSTLGALVLVCKDEAEAFSALPAPAFGELGQVTSDIERGLATFRPYDKINYLMLMMTDKDVHFHVLPRYARNQEFDGLIFDDAGWPGPPDLGAGSAPEPDRMAKLTEAMRHSWDGLER